VNLANKFHSTPERPAAARALRDDVFSHRSDRATGLGAGTDHGIHAGDS